MTTGFENIRGLEGRFMGDESDVAGLPTEFQPAGGNGDDPLTRNLKKVYDEVAAEPIPEEWIKLLDQLDAKGEGRSNG